MRARVMLAVVLACSIAVATRAAFAAGATKPLTTTSGAAASAKLTVLGFQSEGSPPVLIDRSARSLTEVGVDGVNLTTRGRVSSPDAAARAQLRRAHADRLPAVLLVGNWSPRIDDFSERLARRTLSSAAATSAVAVRLAAYVSSEGWNGISVDLESLSAGDGAGLTTFVDDLRAALPARDSLTVCVQASTTPAGYSAGGYDVQALAAAADQIVLMTYDDHGPWENTPGPIGPLPWQRAAVRALVRSVPPSRVLLGAADYGYGWLPHANVNLDVDQARAMVERWHAHPRWVSWAGEWTAQLADGSTLWWSDSRSLTLRLKLARALGLHGVAVWSLGTGDPIPGADLAARSHATPTRTLTPQAPLAVS